MTRSERLKRMLNPASAVFVGGSNLAPAIANTKAKGFAGRIYVVNPFRDEIAGIACHESVRELPEAPDLAFLAVPKEAVCKALAELAAKGVAGTICNAAGFSEMRGEGIDRQIEFVDAAGSMPVLGPNCPGFSNFLDNAAFTQDHFGDHETVTQGVAVVSNGGAYLSDLGCARRSLPIAYLIGTGNQACVSIADVLDVILDDDRVKAVNLYIEGLTDVPMLSRAALKAIRKALPVVVVKGGRSTTGERAARTHTASLAGDTAIGAALFERFGFVEAANPIQAIETLKMLVHTARPKGNRVAFATTSGSYAVIGGDTAEAAGLVMPPMSAETAARVKPHLPPFILPSNPLDFSDGQFAGDEAQAEMFDHYLRDGYDLAMLMMSFPPPGGWVPESWHRTATQFARAAARQGLPCAFINTVPEDLPEEARVAMIAEDMAPLMGLDHGIRAVADAARYAAIHAKVAAHEDRHILLAEPDEPSPAQRNFNEAEAKRLLAEAGVPVPKAIVTSDGIGTDQLAYPVALKALSAEILHKTEIGGVQLGIASPEELPAAIAVMRHQIQEARPGTEVSSFLVEEMVADSLGELLVGVRGVPGIGQVMTLAMGGVTAELLQDSASLILPAATPTIERSLRQLKLFPMLDGWRSRPAADVTGIVATIAAIAKLAERFGSALDILEINPLLVGPARRAGPACIAVDAVLRLRGGP